MFLEVCDLITKQFYLINTQSICYFTKQENEMKCTIYYIVLNDGTKISVNHKRWVKIMNKLAKNRDRNDENKY